LACVLASFFAIFAYAVGRVLIYGPTLHRITFGPDALYFEPPLIDEELRRVKQVSRSELGAIRLQPLRVRQSVTIDRGVWRLDTGAWLAYEDRAWLAEVLRAWAGRQESDSPTTLRPPDGSWIKVEGAAGAWRLSWQPPTNRLLYEWMRWNLILAQAHLLLAWIGLGVFLKVFCGRVLIQQLGGGWVWVVSGYLALLALLTWHSLTTLRKGVADIRQLFAKTRPESVTLTHASLTHDPGNFILPGSRGYKIHTGAPQVIPLAEIDDVGLDPVTRLARLVVRVHGQEERIIGSCLRPPEREWLAELLRSWAEKSDSVPAAGALAEAAGAR